MADIPLSIPKEFLEWYRKTYGEEAYAAFRKTHSGLRMSAWWNTPEYLYWKQNVAPIQAKDVEIAEGASPEEAESVLTSLVTSGRIREEDAYNYLVGRFPGVYEPEEPFDPYTAEENLKAARTQEEAEEILGSLVEHRDWTPKKAQDYLDTWFPYPRVQQLQEATTRQEAESVLQSYVADRTMSPKDVQSYLNEWFPEPKEPISPLERRERTIQVGQSVQAILSNPYATPEDRALFGSAEWRKLYEGYLSGEDNQVVGILKGINQRAQGLQTRATDYQNLVEKQAEQVEAGRAIRVLGGLGRTSLPETTPKQIPPMPGTEGVTTPIVAETGLAEGSRLRQFLEGKVIPETIAETRTGREAWWQSVNQPQQVGIGDNLQQLRMDVARWGKIAGEKLPAETEVGGIYYGTGGLKGIAERTYQRGQEMLGQLTTEATGQAEQAAREGYPVRKPPPDPLIASLQERMKTWKPEYYRGAGTGLRRALTPSVRY